MIRATGVFLDTSAFTAWFVVKHHDKMEEGILPLRDESGDLPILKDWKSARALLSRMRAAAAPFLDGKTGALGKAWIETLPGNSATPWALEENDYAQAHVRTRTCLIPSPDAYSLSGADRSVLLVGSVHVVEHRILHSEINLSVHPRTHLIVDLVRPPADAD